MDVSSFNFCFLFFMIIIIANNIVAGADDDHDHFSCTESRCGENGPPIRFPFRLKDSQPSHCGYPGFDLLCTSSNTTQLELPVQPWKFLVRSIDYASQEIQVDDPHYCLAIQLLLPQVVDLKHNLIPFKYGYREKNSSYTLLNCTMCSTLDIITPRTLCLPIVPIPSDYEIQNFPSDYSCCTKMNDIKSLPSDTHMLSKNTEFFIPLTWSKPDCRGCEAKGKRCRVAKDAAEAQHDDDDDDVEIECVHVPNPRRGTSEKSSVIVTTIGLLIVCPIVVAATFYLQRLAKNDRESCVRIEKFLEDYVALKPSRYTYADIKKITSRFKDKLGQGAYGTVFKGRLSNDVFVAVKILNNTKENGEEFFINEVATMGRIHHVNVVRLVGYCAEGFKRALVFEFLPNDSLDKYISSSAAAGVAVPSLSWETLQNIALGIAKGLEYLHQGCDQRILHFDIKPSNILLDKNFIPKISDFGMAKLCSKDQSMVSISTARGTMGYIAPEVFSWNFENVSYKSDVYSFGILLLEMVGRRKNTNVTEENTDEIYYPEWIYNLLEEEEEEDFRILIEEEGDEKTARRLAIVGLWCIQWHPVSRPAMNVVVQMLEGNKELSMPPNPFASKAPSKATTKILPRRMALGLEVINE